MNTQKSKTQKGHILKNTMSLFNEDGFGKSSKLFGYTKHTLLNKLHGMNNIKFIDRRRISIIANVT
jgi:hypothetical protein